MIFDESPLAQPTKKATRTAQVASPFVISCGANAAVTA